MGQNSKPILLVEDREDDIFLMERAFQKAQISNPLHIARSGREALDYLQSAYEAKGSKDLPCLIFLDLKMPEMSGLEFLQEALKRPEFRQIITVVLTTSSEIADINQAYDFQANSYLVKPSSFEALLELVKTATFYWLNINTAPNTSAVRNV